VPDSAIPLEWLVQAKRDLESARVLRSASPSLLEPAIYHAAQSTEKALKALLIKHGVSYRQLHHDIPALLTETITIEPGLSIFTIRLARISITTALNHAIPFIRRSQSRKAK
jgi:HEPN domain-containing protein